jgi:hypothetical protein
MRRLRAVLFSGNPAENAFVVEFLTSLAGGDPNNINESVRERGQSIWQDTVRLFTDLNHTFPENTAIDYLTMTKGGAPPSDVLRRFDLDG